MEALLEFILSNSVSLIAGIILLLIPSPLDKTVKGALTFIRDLLTNILEGKTKKK